MKWEAVTLSAAAHSRIAEAATFERRIRTDAFLDVVANVGVFKIRQITAFDFLKLEYIENNLITGAQTPDTLDYISFLWQLRPINDCRKEKAFAKNAAQNLNYFIKNEIRCFVAGQMNDTPTISKTNTQSVDNSAESSLAIASLVDLIASQYGWSESDILKTPISRLLQYAQRINKRALGDKYNFSNPITEQARASELNNG